MSVKVNDTDNSHFTALGAFFQPVYICRIAHNRTFLLIIDNICASTKILCGLSIHTSHSAFHPSKYFCSHIPETNIHGAKTCSGLAMSKFQLLQLASLSMLFLLLWPQKTTPNYYGKYTYVLWHPLVVPVTLLMNYGKFICLREW